MVREPAVEVVALQARPRRAAEPEGAAAARRPERAGVALVAVRRSFWAGQAVRPIQPSVRPIRSQLLSLSLSQTREAATPSPLHSLAASPPIA